MSFPRGRAHKILPFARHTHATVSIRTGTILPHSRETWPRQTLPAPGTAAAQADARGRAPAALRWKLALADSGSRPRTAVWCASARSVVLREAPKIGMSWVRYLYRAAKLPASYLCHLQDLQGGAAQG